MSHNTCVSRHRRVGPGVQVVPQSPWVSVCLPRKGSRVKSGAGGTYSSAAACHGVGQHMVPLEVGAHNCLSFRRESSMFPRTMDPPLRFHLRASHPHGSLRAAGLTSQCRLPCYSLGTQRPDVLVTRHRDSPGNLRSGVGPCTPRL